MIRITELRLAIDHAPEALELAIVRFLKIAPKDLISFEVFKRSYDARKNVALAFIYTIDVSVKDEAQVLTHFAGNIHVRPSPDTRYHFIAKAPQKIQQRPVVIGFGPCGIFAALLLAQMGFKRARKSSAGAYPRYLGLMAQKHTKPRIQCAIWGGRCRYLFRWQIVEPG
jgi:uncharacterized FAD-dependent dehydrogenase